MSYDLLVHFSTILGLAFDPYDKFGFLTGRLYRLIHNIMEVKGVVTGFPPSCVGILAELWQRDHRTQKELGQALVKTKSSINKMLISLEKADMIIRQIDPDDHRSKIISLTAKGIAFEDHITERAQHGECYATEGLTQEEVQTAKKVLRTMYDNLQLHYQNNL